MIATQCVGYFPPWLADWTKYRRLGYYFLWLLAAKKWTFAKAKRKQSGLV